MDDISSESAVPAAQPADSTAPEPPEDRPEPVAPQSVISGTFAAPTRRPVWPIVAALAVGALLAANVAVLVLVRSDVASVADRIGALEGNVGAIGSAVDEASAAIGDVESRVGGVEGQLGDLAASAASAAGASAAPTDGAAAIEGALPRFAPGQPDAALGAVLGTVAGPEWYSGDAVTIDPADGTARAWMVWAHWCPYCQEELPELKAWHEANAAGLTNFELVSVTTSIDPSRGNPLEAYLQDEAFPFPVIVDADGTLTNLFGVNAFPFWVFTGPDGAVLGRSAGLLQAEQFAEIFRQLDEIAAT